MRVRDKSLVCEEFSFEDKLGMLKLSGGILDEIYRRLELCFGFG